MGISWIMFRQMCALTVMERVLSGTGRHYWTVR